MRHTTFVDVQTYPTWPEHRVELRAYCSCGWYGPHRALELFADQDATKHEERA